MKPCVRILVFSLLIAVTSTATAAQSSIGWDLVKTSIGQEIYLQTKNKTTHFGILREASDQELGIQIARKQGLDLQVTTIQRNEISTIREAELLFKGKNVGKGAWIGAAVGAGAGILTVYTRRKEGDGQIGLAVPVFAIYGAGAGALVGYFVKKSHKKGKTIYSI